MKLTTAETALIERMRAAIKEIDLVDPETTKSGMTEDEVVEYLGLQAYLCYYTT